jgi:GAF domain-containing protein/FHA domain-containing protein
VAARLTLFPSRGASRHYILRDGESRHVGRDPEANTLVLDDPRVSARHALLEWTGSGWSLTDLSSKNGTFVAGLPASAASLRDGEWVSFGGLLSRFELLRDEEVALLESERTRRLQTSVEIARELAGERDPRVLLERLLRSVLSLTSAERGVVLLLGPGGKLQAEVASGFSDTGPADRFEGSLGAIERVLETGQSLVASDAVSDEYLGRRPSVLELGIATLACAPLRSEDRVIGVVYVDGRKAGGLFTDLDLEILETLAANVAVVLSSLRIDREIRELLGEGGSSPQDRGFLDALERRLSELARSGRPTSSGSEVAPAS